MKPPELKRFNEGDYPGAPVWFAAFIGVLNRFMEQVTTILNKNVTIGENVTGRFYDTTFRTRADYATGGFQTISVNWPFPTRPASVTIAAISTDPATKILNAVSCQWVFNSTGITIVYVAGLTAGTNYTISFLCL